jgi:hypothetical protein
LCLTWLAGFDRNKPSGRRRRTETLKVLRTSKEKRPFAVVDDANSQNVHDAGVATFLMCCQCGEGDQTLSLNTLQLTGRVAALSHTSACLDGLAGSPMPMGEYRCEHQRRM